MSADISKKATGAWVVHHARKLDAVHTLTDYGTLRVAGKAGVLLSILSTDSQSVITDAQVRILAAAAGIDVTFELPTLLDRLQKQQLISRGTGGIEVLGLTSSTVLQHTADLFTSQTPSKNELATITLAEKCSEQPILARDAAAELADRYHLSRAEVDALLRDVVRVGFTDAESYEKEQLLFNGSLFRRDEVAKTQRVLASLRAEEHQKVLEMNELLTHQPCVPLEDCRRVAGKELLEKLLSVGMFELNEVSNPAEVTVYVSKPSAFCKFGADPNADAFDMAKALVAALSYGMNRSASTRGRITLVDRLLEKLVLGHWVGPATAIGEDYRVLERQKVVEVQRQGHSFSMKLLKKEVGEIARAAIAHGEASEYSLVIPQAAITGYRGPEEQRVQVREKRAGLDNSDLTEILHSLRSGG